MTDARKVGALTYAEMPVTETWEGTNDLRQVVDAVQGLVGIQRMWRCRETGETKWKMLPSIAAQEIAQ